jgi:hypothetical protein
MDKISDSFDPLRVEHLADPYLVPRKRTQTDTRDMADASTTSGRCPIRGKVALLVG